MISEKDLLSIFYANVCNYFSGSCPAGKCSLVKKPKEKGGFGSDFFVILNHDAHRKHIKRLKNSDLEQLSPVIHDEQEEFACYFAELLNIDSLSSKNVILKLIELSRSWPIRIFKCSVENGRLNLYLDKVHLFQKLLSFILSAGPLYGKLLHSVKEVIVTCDEGVDDEWIINLTDYRVSLVSQVLINLLMESGCSVSHDEKNEHEIHYHVSSKSAIKGSLHGVLILCEAVVDSKKKCKEKGMTFKNYLRLRCNLLREMSRQKYGAEVDSDSWDSYFENIGKAAVQIDLLCVRPSRALNLNFQEDCIESNSNAPFILYNCARLSALQEQFEKKCSENVYPSLVPIEEVDFSLLVKEEEWELLTSYLLMYPHVLQSAIEYVDEGKPMPNLICNFLYSLCNCYSGYYRRVRILTEPREQLLPVMFARIYLLKAVEMVLHHGLRILGIEPVRKM